MKELAPKGRPVFLSGDFNSTIGDDIFTPLKLELRNARTDSPKSDFSATYNGFGTVKPDQSEWIINHIFFKGAAAVKLELITKDYGVPFISDHYPVAFSFIMN